MTVPPPPCEEHPAMAALMHHDLVHASNAAPARTEQHIQGLDGDVGITVKRSTSLHLERCLKIKVPFLTTADIGAKVAPSFERVR